MKLDISELSHNYITRVIIFSLFVYKNVYKQPNVYKQAVISFCHKRLSNIEISLELGSEMDKTEMRDDVLDNILYDSEIKTNLVTVYYTTGHKKMILNVNLDEEDKYESFLYL